MTLVSYTEGVQTGPKIIKNIVLINFSDKNLDHLIKIKNADLTVTCDQRSPN